jgi:hypothetical protein
MPPSAVHLAPVVAVEELSFSCLVLLLWKRFWNDIGRSTKPGFDTGARVCRRAPAEHGSIYVKLLENWFVRGLLGQERRAIERSAFKYLEKTRHETLVWASLESVSCASGIRRAGSPVGIATCPLNEQYVSSGRNTGAMQMHARGTCEMPRS